MKKLTENQLRIKFNKSKKLYVTGFHPDFPVDEYSNIWFWRDGEISLSKYYQLDSADKCAHIKFLKSIPIKELSTNDEAILRISEPDYLKKGNTKFLSLEEESVQISALSELNKLSVNDIINSGEENVRIYLDEFFGNAYTDWETNVRFHPVDKFIKSTNNFMELDELTIKFIKAYKEIKSK